MGRKRIFNKRVYGPRLHGKKWQVRIRTYGEKERISSFVTKELAEEFIEAEKADIELLLTRDVIIKYRKDKTRYEYYDTLFEQQNGKCALCGRIPEQVGISRNGFVVDHDHSSGLVRGLLCPGCNTGLGCFQDSSDRLLRAAEYLVRNKVILLTQKAA